VLTSLSESLKWQDELAAHTKKLIMYPAFVGTVVVGVTFFMMIYLVPKMAGFIKNMGQELPTADQDPDRHLRILRQAVLVCHPRRCRWC
jgi:type II secretory pathway component PulF